MWVQLFKELIGWEVIFIKSIAGERKGIIQTLLELAF